MTYEEFHVKKIPWIKVLRKVNGYAISALLRNDKDTEAQLAVWRAVRYRLYHYIEANS